MMRSRNRAKHALALLMLRKRALRAPAKYTTNAVWIMLWFCQELDILPDRHFKYLIMSQEHFSHHIFSSNFTFFCNFLLFYSIILNKLVHQQLTFFSYLQYEWYFDVWQTQINWRSIYWIRRRAALYRVCFDASQPIKGFRYSPV